MFRISRPALTAVENGHLARLPVEAFTHADGLPSSQANGASAPAGWRMRDGKLWFATANGVGVIDPDDARRQRAKGITLVVEAVEADGRVLPLQSYHALPADTRRVVIRFTGLNQRAPERLRYRYRMVGFDRDWIETDNGIAHDAVYTNLPSGQLRFELQAMNAPADWARKEGVATQTVAFDKAADRLRTQLVKAADRLAVADQHVADLAGGHEEAQGAPVRIGDGVKLGVHAAFGAADQPPEIPFLTRRLDAVRCAFR